MPKVSEAHLEARRRQILVAAKACFSREGFHKSTMQDICREAGLSPGAVYRYFGSKEEIIEAMAETNAIRNTALVGEAGGQAGTWMTLEKVAGFFFDELAGAEGAAVDVELWAEARRNERIRETLRSNFTEHRRMLADVFRRAQERGEVEEGLDPESASSVMISLFEGLLLQRELDRDEVDVERYKEVVMALVGGSFWRRDYKEADG
jgi:AcrR family transcriptional regulator